jgi:hypothetical protein
MVQREAHRIWIEQCEAAKTIEARFGRKAAFDYIVAENLLNFAEASARHSSLARELPQFVSEIRRMFDTDEISTRLADIEHAQNEEDSHALGDDDPFPESPTEIADRARQFSLIKELLTTPTLGTS